MPFEHKADAWLGGAQVAGYVLLGNSRLLHHLGCEHRPSVAESLCADVALQLGSCYLKRLKELVEIEIVIDDVLHKYTFKLLT